jgi:hypothetical protein
MNFRRKEGEKKKILLGGRTGTESVPISTARTDHYWNEAKYSILNLITVGTTKYSFTIVVLTLENQKSRK